MNIRMYPVYAKAHVYSTWMQSFHYYYKLNYHNNYTATPLVAEMESNLHMMIDYWVENSITATYYDLLYTYVYF